MSANDKFANVPEDELKAYVEASAQKVGESDTDWGNRVHRLEADLLAKHDARTAAPLDLPPGDALAGQVPAPEQSEGHAE